MPRTKILEFNLGDIVESKLYGTVTLITDKIERQNKRYDDKYIYWYMGLELLSGEMISLHTDINSKHYKELA